MIHAEQRSVMMTGLLLSCLLGCTRTTNIGSDIPPGEPSPPPASPSAGAPAPAGPFNPPFAAAAPASAPSTVDCKELVSHLVRDVEEGTCDFQLKVCSDGRSYAMACDGLTCTCHATGSLPATFITPRCPDVEEVNRGCGWTLDHVGGTLAPDTEGARCTATAKVASEDPRCSCRHGIVQCSDDNGCFLSGRWLPAEENFVLQFATDGTLWASNDPRAMLADVRDGKAPGYYGTWRSSGAGLKLRTIHPPHAEPCGGTEPGSYDIRMSPDCDLLELRRSSDSCAERALLAAIVLHRAPAAPIPTE